ncbi:DUF6942 family protein [Celerinatantimonas diazotrophica]|uniref:Uncharacterized protein n=1 Tax=Celerinatantimonas diazotrophica TaxID=412034 RepID=A0A4R1K574_9GAMM|nr:hypothetical protein [Celerinatantimonas diazotrophica]TCK59097.1 hypothetical protein EV690_1265 [Celerinatantimonas diazotrophica]CAG9297735.1 hypothetical protein CEDIAZO_02926 [Celerinatantimonas diazotrophica]
MTKIELCQQDKPSSINDDYIGSSQPEIVMYLKGHYPKLPAPTTQSWLNEFIALNGNNWRKILVIFAKLACDDDNWRDYLYSGQLLRENQCNFTDCLYPSGKVHLLCGKQNWERFGWHDDLNLPGQLWHDHQVLLPYPDYRQFPNQLITQVRQKMEPFITD